MERIGEEEKQALLEVVEGGYLFRYGSPDHPTFKAKVYHLERDIATYIDTTQPRGDGSNCHGEPHSCSRHPDPNWG